MDLMVDPFEPFLEPHSQLIDDPFLGTVNSQLLSSDLMDSFSNGYFDDNSFLDKLVDDINMIEQKEDYLKPMGNDFDDDHSYTSCFGPLSPSGSLSTGRGSSSPTNTISSSSEIYPDILDLATQEIGSPISSPPLQETFSAPTTKVPSFHNHPKFIFQVPQVINRSTTQYRPVPQTQRKLVSNTRPQQTFRFSEWGSDCA